MKKPDNKGFEIRSKNKQKDWVEDFEMENGNYQSKCSCCHDFFIGHKRRFICKECFKLPY